MLVSRKAFRAFLGAIFLGFVLAAAQGRESTALQVLQSEGHGDYLADAEGMSLYLFLPDRDAGGISTCNEQCVAMWPPLLAGGDLEAGDRVDPERIGFIERDDGSRQVTYAGWPLYYYADDSQAGDVFGQGAGDIWYLVSPSQASAF